MSPPRTRFLRSSLPGASTGGFTDCLLQQGAEKVYSVDTGYGLLDWKLRKNPRVVVLERSNILYPIAKLEQIKGTINLAVVDTSWTKLAKSIPATFNYLSENATVLALLKPQYEALPKEIRKGILVPEAYDRIITKVREELIAQGFLVSEAKPSCLKGGKGNQEYWLLIN